MSLPPRPFRFALALLGLTLVGRPARAQEAAAAPQKPFEELSRTLLAGRDSLVRLTKQQVGLKYRWGAQRPGIAFDCSALVQWIAGLFGQNLPRTAAQQALAGIEVPKDTASLLPGDLLMFGRGRRITHVGIYVGDGKYIHAANKRKGVIESLLSKARPSYWKGARRTFLDADSVLSTPTAPES
jgi:cell wall-associated NlpC family hydrolase